jgi:hypothetical protein
MGRPLPGYRWCSLDPVTGERRTEGEICLDLSAAAGGPDDRLPGRRRERNAEAMAGGYYHTGDLASRDADGYITYVGRTDDVFKASDYKISPFELESVLIEHPAVAEAAVVPAPDPLRLAVPKAYVVLARATSPRETALSILAYAREHLAPFQADRRLEFAELPKTISGKIRRVELRGREVPVEDAPIPKAHHDQFLDHMAALHAAFWGAGPEIDIVSPATRFLELSPHTAAAEARLGSDHLVPRLIAQGWPLLDEVAPVAARIVHPLALDPTPLVAALAGTPQTLVHGNFKLDNLGVTPDGRTVLFDWEGSGAGAPTGDLAWYLAINCRRLPVSKEASIATYREALRRHGVDTEPWWDRQLALSLLGGLVQFGWEKAFGGLDEELGWWQDRAVEGARLL